MSDNEECTIQVTGLCKAVALQTYYNG